MTPFFWAFIEREKTLDLFQMMSGQRMMPSWIVPGGLRGDMPEGWEQKLRDFIAVFPGALAEVESLLVTNPIWLERTQGVGVLSLKDCLRYGVSGPIIRASGLAWDIRKSNPYSSYDKFDFEIPVGKHGDVYDRFLVRLEEMRQSIRIITQAIDNLPDGPISSSDRKVVPPPREELDTSMEALIHHFLLWTEGYHPPPGEVYVPTESPKGEAGFYIVSDGADAPYRWHLRPPSFMNLQVLDLMCRGGLMADMVACIGSIDIVLGEVDR
jgi:NADH-quinone oxidoreductase subunit D